MKFIEFIQEIRTAWNILFTSKLINHLEAEILRINHAHAEQVKFLQEQNAQLHLDNQKLQLYLNAVNPTGLMAKHMENRTPLNQVVTPGRIRWAALEEANAAKNRQILIELAAKQEAEKNSIAV